MKYLIDTHTLLWAITDDDELSEAARELLSFPDKNDILVSTVSFWEIAIKTSIGKLNLENFDFFRLQEYCDGLGFSVLKLDAQDSLYYAKLPLKEKHKDPFDRMLIATAINNGFTFVSRDHNMPLYREDGLSVFW
jgi:PIN domain nuclease of toxin-antitoxin system